MKIFLDCDGVLADFVGQCVKLWGKTPTQLGDAELWRLVNEDAEMFWSTMAVLPGAAELIELARPYGGTILTGCPFDANDETKICAIADAEKKLWIPKLAADIPVITCFSRDKPLHMESSRDILVDDWLANIQKWDRAGGWTVWYRDPAQAIKDLKHKIETLERLK